MSYSEYSTKATIKDEAMIDRIKKAFFHFNGPITWKEKNRDTGVYEKKTKIVERDAIDLAVLLGIRETCYKQEGDIPLNEEEIYRFLEILNEQHVIHSYIAPVKENRTHTWDELMRFFIEWYERLVTGTVTENADGSVEVYLYEQTHMSLWRALTTIYPGSEIDVWEYEDFDDGDYWYKSYDRFTVKYGTKKQTDYIYDEGSWDYEEDEESKSSENEGPEAEESAKEPSTYDVGMDYAYKGEYEKSIEVLSTLEGNVDALNNIGVNYEKLGQYQKAYEYYLKANTPWSLNNLLGLYNNGKIPMNIDDFKKQCEQLIKMGDYHGYIYLSDAYVGGHKGLPINHQLALKYAKEGFNAYPNTPYVVFHLAWCLSEYAKNEEDKKESHRLYGSILNDEDDEDGTVYLTARNNYALQCLDGYGCEQDISKAIYWFKKAFEGGYIDAAKNLAKIYSTVDDFRNQEFANFWNQQYKENEGKEN